MNQEKHAPQQLIEAFQLFKQHAPAIRGALVGLLLHLFIFVVYHFAYVKPACIHYAESHNLEFEDIHYPSGGKGGYGRHYLLGYCKLHTIEPISKEPQEKRIGLWEIMGARAIPSFLAIPLFYIISMIAGAFLFYKQNNTKLYTGDK